MSKLTVVYVKSTGHVLAALTRVNPPQATEPVGDLVGTGLLVRFIGNLPADATVSAQELGADTVDDQSGVVISPQSFKFGQDSQGHPQVTEAGPGSQVTLALTITSGAMVTAPNPSTPALVGLQQVTTSGQAPVTLFSATVGTVTTVVQGPGGFASGETWNMYALVKDVQPVAQTFHL